MIFKNRFDGTEDDNLVPKAILRFNFQLDYILYIYASTDNHASKFQYSSCGIFIILKDFIGISLV